MFFLCLVLPLLFLTFTGRCYAALGGPPDSVESDMRALAATRGPMTNYNGYTVQDMTYSGTTVREYISSSGVVFAIAWSGQVQPDLSALLGAYLAEYENTLQVTPRTFGRSYLKVTAGNIVVEKGGHMGNLWGRAYIPALLAPDVSPDMIK
jgi:hypothetical protein